MALAARLFRWRLKDARLRLKDSMMVLLERCLIVEVVASRCNFSCTEQAEVEGMEEGGVCSHSLLQKKKIGGEPFVAKFCGRPVCIFIPRHSYVS